MNSLMAPKVSTALVHIPHKPFSLGEVFRRHGVIVRAREGAAKAFGGIGEISERLTELLESARGISLEIDRGVSLSMEGLEEILRHATNLAARLGDEFLGINLSLSFPFGGKLIVDPRTFLREDVRKHELFGLRLSSLVIQQMDGILGAISTENEAEVETARILARYFKAARIKAYDVAEDGSVRVSHSYSHDRMGTTLFSFEMTESRFKEWVNPEAFADEVMGSIIVDDLPYVLVPDPTKDSRCIKTKGGGPNQIEQLPFLMLAEKIDGKTRRIYKVEWTSQHEFIHYVGFALNTVFGKLAATKLRLREESEKSFLDEITRISIREKNLNKALADISQLIAGYICDKAGRPIPDRVTIMLHDVYNDALVTRIIWTPKGVQEVDYYSGPRDWGIGRVVFDGNRTILLRSLADWKESSVNWRNGGKGSMVAATVSGDEGKVGVVTVSSQEDNAFSEEHLGGIKKAARHLGPAFERVARHLAELQLDPKFSAPKFGSLKVFNPRYLNAKLDLLIKHAAAGDSPLCLLYLDIDKFAHLNNAWLHDDVDFVLAEIFSRLVANLRNEEVCRHGGEEIVVIGKLTLEAAIKVAMRLRGEIEKPITVRIPYADSVAAVRTIKAIRTKAKEFPLHGINLDAIRIVRGRAKECFLEITAHKTVSIGISTFEEGDTSNLLLGRADEAMQAVKAAGRNGVATYVHGEISIINCGSQSA
ncbi:MAG: diguanylate cyclase [Candidatus Margulisiibacteriota bacterium]